MSVGEAIWRMLPLAEGLVRPFSFSGKPFISSWATTPEQLTRGLMACPQGASAYVQLNASRRTGWRARAEDVPAIQAVLVDLDPLGDRTDMDDVYTVGARLRLLGVQADQMALIDSGRGFQWWVLVNGTPNVLASRIGAFLRRVSDGLSLPSCIIDLSCSDLPRLARAPGTINPKTGKIAHIIREGVPGGWSWLETIPEPPPYEPPSQVSSDQWQAYLPHLTESAKRFLGGSATEGERHRLAYATAASLLECGATPPVIHDAFLSYLEVSAFLYARFGGAKPLESEDLSHALNTAMRRRSANQIPL